MTRFIKAPKADRGKAKAHGAIWGVKARLWFAPNSAIREDCKDWPGVTGLAKPRNGVESVSKAVRGERYFTMHCNCLPWDPCSVCRQQMADVGDGWLGQGQMVQEALLSEVQQRRAGVI